jgi:hypothetical protein
MSASEPLYLKPIPQAPIFPVTGDPPPERTFWGLRSPQRVMELRAWSPLVSFSLPEDAFFTHTTAAILHGIPLPERVDDDPRLHVTVEAPAYAVRRRGIIGHSLVMSRDDDVIGTADVEFTTPERTWCDLAGLLTFPELVAAGDYLVHRQDPITTPRRLEQQVHSLRYRRYIRALYSAVRTLRDSSESPAESELHTICTVLRLPPPIIDRETADDFGEFVALTTFRFTSLGLMVRYWGAGALAPAPDTGAHREVIDGVTWMVLDTSRSDLSNPNGLMRRIWRYLPRPVTPVTPRFPQ